MRGILVVLVLLSIPSGSSAIVIGGSNLGYGGYPQHNCMKPFRPTRPYSFTSDWQIENYNTEVRRFNMNLRTYLDCIDQYVDNGRRDMRRIQQRMQQAIDEASSV